ncbi:4-hydroxybenzoate polyprenyl transferase family protein [Xylaria bambusicola]|uniref:4-hydroxybenzoate polyprenyl transferase family protein n=1 Tax=Xylaria bambusicola TaxID=326684 RepID=UPI002007548C|nr:4-hydroxybenzoate polyprenyl transferase family protein [Xylaria bambusicola]KAI0518268.1 4-hydroxybenzoate polyprenyl transferase family protein [Xylaria bambusicola]
MRFASICCRTRPLCRGIIASRLGRHVSTTSRIKSPLARQTAVSFVKPTQLIPISLASASQRRAHTLDSPSSPVIPEPYSPPTTGLLSRLPPSWVPYAELMRLEKPAGTIYLFFPCLFSTLLAAPLTTPVASPLSVLGTSALFFSGALIMRSAGCSINDLWDRNLDPKVARTRLRPIARGALTPFKAFAFTGAQLLTGLVVLLQFPFVCLFYGIPSLLLVATYPLAKRVTYYPQFVLGLTFSWGAMMGFPALGVDLLAADAGALRTAAALLYASNVSWTVLYDMIYAHMDIKDDAKAGIKSIALKHDADTKKVLGGLAVVQIGLLAAAGIASGAGPAFFIGSCGGAALTLGYMIKKVNLKSVKNCWWWFVHGCWITGGVISFGLGADYLIQYLTDNNQPEIETQTA